MEQAIEIVEDTPAIDRGSLLDTIDTIFSANTDVLIIRGQEEIGKTTLLRQFAARHQGQVIGIFINAQSRWAYDDQNILTEIYQLLTALLNQKEETREIINLAIIRELYIAISRRMRLHNKYIYFILDGIDEIPSADDSSRKTILDMLPIGYHNIRFLISTERAPELRNVREFFVPPFSMDETAALFSDLNFTRKQIEEIRQTFRGNPGHMLAVRRVAKHHRVPAELLEDLPRTLPEIFELEWRPAESAPDCVLDALAIVAFDRKEYTYNLLGEILEQEVLILKKSFDGFSFIEVTLENTLCYTSDSYKKFATNKLKNRYIKINNRLIDFLLKNPHSDDALKNLPRHMYQAQRFDDLLKYLSPAHFTVLLERSESLVSIQQKAQLGVSTASQLHRYGDLFRFGVQLSSTGLIAGVETWRTEIEARVTLKDYAAAKRIAHSALLKENRFHLLVVMAKMQRELDLNADPDILAQIDQLYSEISFEELGDRAHEIAADLIFVRPSLAIQIVEKATRSRVESTDFEWELARLSFDAAREQLPKEKEYRTAQLIQSRLYDPSAQRFSAAAWLLMGTYSAKEAIAEVQKIAETSEKLSLLRIWTKRNRRSSDAIEVIKHSLELAIRDTSFSITAQVLLDLAQPLPFIENEHERRSLLGVFEAQRPAAERLGPTDDYINMYLIMIRAECLHDKSSAFSKLTDIFIQISYIPDIATRASCLAKLIVALMIIDPKYELEKKEQLHTTTSDEFLTSIDKLLKDSAEHLAAVNASITTLARYSHMLATDVVNKLNTCNRRDDANMIILKEICNGALNNERIGNAIATCKSMQSPHARDIGLHRLIRSAFEEKKAAQVSDKTILTLINNAINIEQLDLKCRAIGVLYGWLQKNNRLHIDSPIKDWKVLICKTWDSIDTAWIKVDVGFDLVRILNAADEDFARMLLSRCDEIRREQVFGVDTSVSVYAQCIQLSARALSGLMPRKLDTEIDLIRLEELINNIPCRGSRAQAWSDIAYRYFSAKRIQDCKDIITTKVNPLIDALSSTDPMLADLIVTRCASAIYVGNPLFAIERIKKISYPNQDEAWSNICDSITLKRNPFEYFDKPSKIEARLSYEEIGELIALANYVFSDAIVYSIIADISQILSLKTNRNILSSQQKSDIVQKLDTLINKKLPNPNFIKHDGWKVLALAQLERIRHSGKEVWQAILKQARSISNTADRVLVLASLAGMSWGDLARSSGELFEEAYELAKVIPTALDRMMRLRAIAAECSLSEPAIARKCLSDAMTFAVNADETDMYAANERRRIIDLAYKMDAKLADKLADMADADPARLRAREELKHELRVLKSKQDIISNSDAFSSPRSKAQTSSIIEASSLTLAALNAGRVQPLTKERVQESVRFASSYPFSQTYSVFSLAIESMVKRYKDTSEANNYLRAIFDGAIRASELVWRVTARTNGMIPAPNMEPQQPEASSILVKSGERDKAVQFIENWLRTSATQYIKICDPYFSPEDLDWLKKIQNIAPSLKVQILSSMSYQIDLRIANDLASQYRGYWRLNLADQQPPDTEIWIVGTEKDGDFPIHDRWILSLDSGLRLGTSLNGFGSRESEISILSPPEVVALTAELEKYFLKQVKEHKGQRLKYTFFDL